MNRYGRLTFSSRKRRSVGRAVRYATVAVFALISSAMASPAPSRPGNAGSGNAAISADGRSVAIASSASDLVRGDTNGVYDVFVRDRRRGVTVRTSVGPNGVQANGRTGLSAISANGRYVVMWSEASNLVIGDTNGVADVFVRDRVTKTTERVSVGTAGQLDTESGQAAISADGRFVAFASGGNVFVRDRATASTEFVGRGAMPALSADGRYLARNDGGGRVVVRDRVTGATDIASVDSDGAVLQGDAIVPTISANGRWVAFLLEPRLTAPNQMRDVLYVHDRLGRTTTRVGSALGNPTIAPDGRSVAYEGGRAGGRQQVIVRILATGKEEVASVAPRGAANGPSWTGSGPLSYGGRFVAFYSEASNLVERDRNRATDAFVRDRSTRTTSLVSVALAPPRVR
jgi:Tol biopolymer transport system component